MANIVIRNSTKEDYNKLREIFLTVRRGEFLWEDAKKMSMEDFDRSTQGEVIYTALINDNIVGFASIWADDSFIHNLYILKEYRKLGVGKAMINRVINDFNAPITLKCVKENVKAYEFYLANGWTSPQENINEDETFYLMKYGVKIKKVPSK